MKENVFTKYKRKGLSEMILLKDFTGEMSEISVSVQDDLLDREVFNQGYVARNPKNHADLWYVAKKYFDDNLEPADESSDIQNFGFAIESLKKGLCLTRAGWNGKGLFICKQVPSDISAEIVPKMQSLPDGAKVKLSGCGISYRNQMLIVNKDRIADSWVPSSSDIFAEDWYIVE